MNENGCSPTLIEVANEIMERRLGTRRIKGVCCFCGCIVAQDRSACPNANIHRAEANEIVDRRLKEHQKFQNEQKWHVEMSLYEPRFTKLDLLPDVAQQHWNHLKNWKPIDKGLVLHGPTGSGKTRLMFMLLRNLWISFGLKCRYFTCVKLTSQVIESFKNQQHSSFIEGLIDEPILALDDLGKEKITDRMQADLFEIFDQRIVRGHPTIVTTNFVGESLIKRFPEHQNALPFLRRLREDFQHVNFCQLPKTKVIEAMTGTGTNKHLKNGTNNRAHAKQTK